MKAFIGILLLLPSFYSFAQSNVLIKLDVQSTSDATNTILVWNNLGQVDGSLPKEILNPVDETGMTIKEAYLHLTSVLSDRTILWAAEKFLKKSGSDSPITFSLNKRNLFLAASQNDGPGNLVMNLPVVNLSFNLNVEMNSPYQQHSGVDFDWMVKGDLKLAIISALTFVGPLVSDEATHVRMNSPHALISFEAVGCLAQSNVNETILSALGKACILKVLHDSKDFGTISIPQPMKLSLMSDDGKKIIISLHNDNNDKFEFSSTGPFLKTYKFLNLFNEMTTLNFDQSSRFVFDGESFRICSESVCTLIDQKNYTEEGYEVSFSLKERNELNSKFLDYLSKHFNEVDFNKDTQVMSTYSKDSNDLLIGDITFGDNLLASSLSRSQLKQIKGHDADQLLFQVSPKFTFKTSDNSEFEMIAMPLDKCQTFKSVPGLELKLNHRGRKRLGTSAISIQNDLVKNLKCALTKDGIQFMK